MLLVRLMQEGADAILFTEGSHSIFEFQNYFLMWGDCIKLPKYSKKCYCHAVVQEPCSVPFRKV